MLVDYTKNVKYAKPWHPGQIEAIAEERLRLMQTEDGYKTLIADIFGPTDAARLLGTATEDVIGAAQAQRVATRPKKKPKLAGMAVDMTNISFYRRETA